MFKIIGRHVLTSLFVQPNQDQEFRMVLSQFISRKLVYKTFEASIIYSPMSPTPESDDDSYHLNYKYIIIGFRLELEQQIYITKHNYHYMILEAVAAL